MSKMKFVCPEHGEFSGQTILICNPPYSPCPIYGKRVVDLNHETNIMTEEEFAQKHPDLYLKIKN
jgi:hypothetical protein